MGETTTVERPASVTTDEEYYPPATFDETAVETSPEIEAAKQDIERTRSEMSGTIDAIKAQLSPERLVAEAKGAVAEAAAEKVSEVKHAVMDKVSDVAHGASAIASNVVATVSDAAASLGEKATALTGSAKEKWSDLTADNGENGTSVATVAGVAGSKIKETGDLLMDTIRENPVPAALVGVGLGWLLVDAALKQQQRASHPLVSGTNGYRSDMYSDTNYGATSGASYGAYATNNSTNGISNVVSKASDKLHNATDKIGDAIGDARSKVSDTAHGLQDKASDLVDSAQSKASDLTNTVQAKASDLGYAAQNTARKAVNTTQDFITENPIAAGALALLAGAVIGLTIPATAPENQLLGAQRDRFADQAGQVAHDLLGKVQNVAGEAMNVAKSSLADVKDQVQQTVQTQARDQGLVPA